MPTIQPPKQTRAAILVEQNAPLAVETIDLPQSLDVGQVLVRLKYSGICGSQIGEIDGVKGPDKWLPHLLGHEGSGDVLATGPGVKHVRSGDSVVLHWRPSLGIEAVPPKYSLAGKTVNAGWVTTFNEYAVVSENRLTVIDPSTNMKVAALYGCAITTGFGVIDNKAKVRLGESVVVFGAGGIGLNIVQGAALAGASKIVAVDRFANRLELAARCGATHTIDGSVDDPWDALADIFTTDRPNVFIDNTGNTEVIARGYEFSSNQGRVILVGVPKVGNETRLHTLKLHFGKEITGSHGGEAVPHVDILRYMGLTGARNIDLNEIVTDIGPLSEINHLIQRMRDGTSAGRCLIDFSL